MITQHLLDSEAPIRLIHNLMAGQPWNAPIHDDSPLNPETVPNEGFLILMRVMIHLLGQSNLPGAQALRGMLISQHHAGMELLYGRKQLLPLQILWNIIAGFPWDMGHEDSTLARSLTAPEIISNRPAKPGILYLMRVLIHIADQDGRADAMRAKASIINAYKRLAGYDPTEAKQ